MAFVKLDTGILDSTLWLDRNLREVFITALLMAQPCEFSESNQQIEVDSLKTTDFLLPPGWYGFVQAAGMGIINRAGVPRAEGMEALRKLGSPEAESRSEHFDGRRMVRVNGGYVILNFMRYRDKDHTGAVRAKNLRLRRKLGIDSLLKEQDYKCDCCESQFTEPYRDSVIQDHHHASGGNRGLICPSCNIVIGIIESGKKTHSSKKQLCLDYINRYAVTSQGNCVTPSVVTQAEDRVQSSEIRTNPMSLFGENGEVQENPKKEVIVKAWDYYKTTFGRNGGYDFSPARQNHAEKAWKVLYQKCKTLAVPEEDRAEKILGWLCDAIDNMRSDDFHNGVNDRREKYNDWENLFSSSKIASPNKLTDFWLNENKFPKRNSSR